MLPVAEPSEEVLLTQPGAASHWVSLTSALNTLMKYGSNMDLYGVGCLLSELQQRINGTLIKTDRF